MVFKGPGGFGRIVNGLLNLALGAALTFYVLWFNQNLHPEMAILTPLYFFKEWVICFAVGYVYGEFVPAGHWGHILTSALGIKSKLPEHFVSTIVLAFVMVTLVSFSCNWIAHVMNGGLSVVFAAWISVWPVLLAIGYCLMLFMLPLAFKLGTAISGFDPHAHPAHE